MEGLEGGEMNQLGRDVLSDGERVGGVSGGGVCRSLKISVFTGFRVWGLEFRV